MPPGCLPDASQMPPGCLPNAFQIWQLSLGPAVLLSAIRASRQFHWQLNRQCNSKLATQSQNLITENLHRSQQGPDSAIGSSRNKSIAKTHFHMFQTLMLDISIASKRLSLYTYAYCLSIYVYLPAPSARGSCSRCTASCGYFRPLSRYQFRLITIMGYIPGSGIQKQLRVPHAES